MVEKVSGFLLSPVFGVFKIRILKSETVSTGHYVNSPNLGYCFFTISRALWLGSPARPTKETNHWTCRYP